MAAARGGDGPAAGRHFENEGLSSEGIAHSAGKRSSHATILVRSSAEEPPRKSRRGPRWEEWLKEACSYFEGSKIYYRNSRWTNTSKLIVIDTSTGQEGWLYKTKDDDESSPIDDP